MSLYLRSPRLQKCIQLNLPKPVKEGILVQKDVATPYLNIVYHVPETQHEDYYALTLLSDILTSGKSSRLYSALVDKRQLATAVFTDYGQSFDPYLFGVYAVTSKGINETELEKAFMKK